MTNSVINNPLQAIQDQIDGLTSALSASQTALASALESSSVLDVTSAGIKLGSVSGVRHTLLPTLIKLASARLPILLVGAAGTGKTHAALQVASALGLPFETISVGAQTSKSDLLGFMTATGTYIETAFRRMYEHGTPNIIE